ncbi:MAG: hypothetical protein AAF945_03735 [Actinomycetota bacterium]
MSTADTSAPDDDLVTREPDSAVPHTVGRRRLRSVAVALLGVFSLIGILGGVLGFWTLRVASDSDRFEERVEELLASEEISDSLARRVLAEFETGVDLRSALVDTLPDALEPAVDPLLAGVRSRLELALGEVIRDDRLVEVVGAAAGRAHELAVNVIRGEATPDGVVVEDGEVRLNLLPLVVEVIELAQDVGLFGDADLSSFDSSADPDEQRDQIASALDRSVPDRFGEVVVFDDDRLEEAGARVDAARDVLEVARRTFWLLLLIGVGLAAATVVLSVDRWRSASLLVGGVFSITLVVRWLADRVVDRLPDAVDGTGASASVAELAEGLEQSLNRTLLAFSAVALLALIAAAVAVARAADRDPDVARVNTSESAVGGQ